MHLCVCVCRSFNPCFSQKWGLTDCWGKHCLHKNTVWHGARSFTSLSVQQYLSNLGFGRPLSALMLNKRQWSCRSSKGKKKKKWCWIWWKKWILWCCVDQLLRGSMPSHQKGILNKTFLKWAFLMQDSGFNSSDMRHFGYVLKMGRINIDFY